MSTKFLVIGPAWIGDMVMAQTLFKLLKQQYLDSCIDVMAPTWNHALLERMPEVHTSLALPLQHGEFNLVKRYQLGKSLGAHAYDHCIVLPNSWKSALIPFFARIPKRTGWLGEARWGLLNDFRYLDKTRYPQMTQRFAALAFPAHTTLPDTLPKPALFTREEQLEATCQKYRLTPASKPILALCPGAEYGPAKRWPAEYFAAVARHQLAQGQQVWLFGSSKENAIGESIQSLTNAKCINLIGKMSLGEAIDLLSLAHTVISNDSGLMHVACALKKPLIAIYGSSDQRFTPPLHNQVKILSSDLPCRPCFQRECPLQHLQCLHGILPATVIYTLENGIPCVS